MRIEIMPTAAEVGTAAAEDVVQALERARSAGRRPLVGWPVGRTPGPVVTALAAAAAAGRVDLHDAVFVGMDEYVEPVGDSWQAVPEALGHSCRGSARREIVGPLNAALPPGRRLGPEAFWSPDPGEPQEIETRIADAGGIELFLVALGATDGHIALNAPGSGRHSRTRVVRLPVSTRQDNLETFGSLHRLDDVPTHGVTVGLATITDAHRLCVLAFGSTKRAVAGILVEAAAFDPRWPMTAVVDHQQTHVILDTAACPSVSEVAV